MRADLQRLERDKVSGSASATSSASRVAASHPGTVVPALPVTFFRLKWIAPTVVILLILGGLVLRQKFFLRPPVQHGPVSLLLTDFNNTTGDPVFNGTLEPMLEVALEGASFVSVYNRGQARKVAAQVQPGTSVVDDRLGRLVAMREGGSVVVSGSISSASTGDKVFVQTTDAATGKKIQSKQLNAPSKDSVLTATVALGRDNRRGLWAPTPE